MRFRFCFSTPAVFAGLLAVSSACVGAPGESVFKNFLGIEFVDIPAGQFVRGSCLPKDKAAEVRTLAGKFLARPSDDDCVGNTLPDVFADAAEVPQAVVTVVSFQMATTEMTVGQVKELLRVRGSALRITPAFVALNSRSEDSAAVGVSRHAAYGLVQSINDLKPVTDKGRYRLPSEAEWEYVARAGTTSRYYFGDSTELLAEYAWFGQGGDKGGWPVAKKKSNAWGLFDMYGNAGEWAGDCWRDNHRNAETNSAVQTSGCDSDSASAMRGGSWKSTPAQLRSASRAARTHVIDNDETGIRLVRYFEAPRQTLELK